MAAIFIAQATNTPLSLMDQLVVLGVLMITSKGSAGVTGSGFITLAATLASMGKIPVSGMVLLLGVDRFMSEARAITNTIGNGVGTLVVARWVGAVDKNRMNRILNGEQLEQIEQEGLLAPHGHEVREDVPVGLVKPHNVSA
jgi:aerobic C4-dicarboxylate transport protein